MTPALPPYIKAQELFKERPYTATLSEAKDNIYSIGYGTVFIPGKGRVTPDMQPITEAVATNYLLSTLSYLEQKISHMVLIFPNLTPWEIDGLLALFYNLGTSRTPMLFSYLNKNNLLLAAKEFMNCIYEDHVALSDLCYRRASDYDIFTKNIYQRRYSIPQEHKDILLEMNTSQQAIQVINSLKMGK